MIGRSENVLTGTVDILLADGQTAGATNDFDNVLALFDATSLNLVVFGGMVPPDTKEDLRARLRAANPDIGFVQGLAGIPGLIAAQVEAALAPTGDDTRSVTYDAGARVLKLSLQSPQAIRVTGFWATSLVPPEPASTSEVIFSERLQPGSHAVPLPASFPTVASFVVVHTGAMVHPFTVGPMPRMNILPPPT
ncbi:MAG: hypothetical protein M3Y33_00865 [Actinomycetota bacterium]|nr:hypothetical protein [Actinomycetota bacterium]